MAETKFFTTEEVQKLVEDKKTAFIIDNGVYDVTEFLNEVSYY